MIGLITLGTKPTGKRSAGKPHAAFDVAGAGNVTMVAGLRSIAKAMGLPPAPTVRAPALDPTCERLGVRLPGATLPLRTRNSGLGFALDEWLALIATGTPQSCLLRGYEPVFVAGPRASMPIIFIIATALLRRETPGFTL